MTRVLLTSAALAVAVGLSAGSVFAENIAPYAPGTPLYGPLQATPPAGEVAPADAPVGYHYTWVYSYDHHGYHAHWELIRNS
ncbi:MAG TPA: hypothetical protein VM782_19210 [Stellaceae bacterium]|nr:hypothetical protein [Stellaceae bacterium]